MNKEYMKRLNLVISVRDLYDKSEKIDHDYKTDIWTLTYTNYEGDDETRTAKGCSKAIKCLLSSFFRDIKEHIKNKKDRDSIRNLTKITLEEDVYVSFRGRTIPVNLLNKEDFTKKFIALVNNELDDETKTNMLKMQLKKINDAIDSLINKQKRITSELSTIKN